VLPAYEGHKRTLDTTARRIAESRHGVTTDRIMREFAHIGFSNIMDYLHVGPGGRVFLDLGKATRDHMAAVQIVEGDVLMVPAEDVLAAARRHAKKGQLLEVPVQRFRLKLYNKHKALAAMGKHLGMF
jgi:phage terminase small subunit